jgi:hypothetical protein
MVEMVNANLKLNYLKKKTSEKDDDYMKAQEERALSKWERLTHFMLNIDNIQNKEELPARQILYEEQEALHEYGLSAKLTQVLLSAGFIRENSEHQAQKLQNFGSSFVQNLNS